MLEDLVVPNIHFACWTRPRVFKGLGVTGMLQKCWQGEHFLTGGPGNLAIYSKGVFIPIFLVNGPFTSKRVLVFEFGLCPDISVSYWGMGPTTLVPGAAGGQSSLLCVCPGCVTYGLDLLSLRSNSVHILLNRTGLF